MEVISVFPRSRTGMWTRTVVVMFVDGSADKGYRELFNDKYTTGTKGGFVVYYVSPGKNQVTAFKPGFRMLVGDAMQRTKIGSGRKSQSCFRCYNAPNFGGDNAAPCADAKLDTEAFPTGPCPGGIRSNILYPT